jgi:hypothetical protein
MSGMADDPKLDRWKFLEVNLENAVDAMKSSGLADPVGFIVEVNEHHGHQCATFSTEGSISWSSLRAGCNTYATGGGRQRDRGRAGR